MSTGPARPVGVMEPALLDRFIARPDVRERFETTVRAPAPLVMQVATDFDLQSVATVRWIFRLRERLLGAQPGARRPQGILAETRSLGWGVLDEEAGRYVVCGARCQPWLADVKFTAIAPEAFAAYAEPGQVKIAWTVEAQEVSPEVTRFAQETRAIATDAASRRAFMRYWRWARFGIVAIRLFMLPAVRRAAERQWAGRIRGAP